MPLHTALGFIEQAIDDKLIKELLETAKKEKNTVLIIDDMYPHQTSISGIIEKVLKKEGLSLAVFKSRSEFKKGFKGIKDKLRFIILDRRIQHRTTTDILDTINELESFVPVILLSRGLKESDIDVFLRKGISLHISKEEFEKEPKKVEELITGILKEGDYLWEWR